jgi:hypothetical protein
MGFFQVDKSEPEKEAQNEAFLAAWVEIDQLTMPDQVKQAIDEGAKLVKLAKLENDTVHALDMFFMALRDGKPERIDMLLAVYARLQSPLCFALVCDFTLAYLGEPQYFNKIKTFLSDAPPEMLERYPEMNHFLGGEKVELSPDLREHFAMIGLQAAAAFLEVKLK